MNYKKCSTYNQLGNVLFSEVNSSYTKGMTKKNYKSTYIYKPREYSTKG